MTADQFEIVDVHMHVWFEEMVQALRPHDAVALNEQALTDMLAEMDRLGISRAIVSILFGSDLKTPDRLSLTVDSIKEASFLSEEDKRKILGDNARKLLGIAAGLRRE